MWKTWKEGQAVKYIVNDFDGHYETTGYVTEIDHEHAIVRADGMNLWVDDFNADMFRSA